MANTAAVAERWEQILAERGLVDFDSIVRHAVEIVEGNAWVRRALAARFPHLFLDEYQDLAPGLDRLVRALCFDETADADLFAVGDPDQSIMGFNGSRPELLLELAERPFVHCVRLETNYRSRASIVQAALRALGEDRNIEWLDEGGEIALHECPEGKDQQHRRMVKMADSAARGRRLTRLRSYARTSGSNVMLYALSSRRQSQSRSVAMSTVKHQ